MGALYGFSPAEARVAMALLDGENAAEIGDRLRVSRETVRTQTKAAYAKMGVRRQGQFIRLALAIPVPARPADEGE
jgi:DNA-binding CsgD family transcriptional regulator